MLREIKVKEIDLVRDCVEWFVKGCEFGQVFYISLIQECFCNLRERVIEVSESQGVK